MGVEKDGSRHGNYVGGFFHLFDWKAKSRKKLFSSKSDVQDDSKKLKRNDGKPPMIRHDMKEEEDADIFLRNGGYGDYSCASSVTDEDGYSSRPAGVVARLMGLDSMPTSSFPDDSILPYLDSQSIREASQSRNHYEYYHDRQILSSEPCFGKEEEPVDPSRNFVELKPQRVLSRPIEKFQTEVLPPKSAKSIPITHHKLLSPIKSPGFIPSKTAAHIMEAAAKIIESCPQPVPKIKMPSVGLSSVPPKMRVNKSMPGQNSSFSASRIRESRSQGEGGVPRVSSKSQVESAFVSRRLNHTNALEKSGSPDVNASFRNCGETEEGFIKNSRKSVSLAIQAKVNVQKREGLSMGSGREMEDQREVPEVIPVQAFKSQSNGSKSLHRKHIAGSSSSSGALKQNNQKQNSVMDKEKLSLKSSTSHLHSRKASSTPGRQKLSNTKGGTSPYSTRNTPRKMSLEATENGKGVSPYSTRNTPRKKRLIDGSLPHDSSQPADNLIVESSSAERLFDWSTESKRKGIDVVSFTFTTPLTRTGSSSEPLQFTRRSDSTENRSRTLSLEGNKGDIKASSVGFNMIGPDALSTLLEQKLKELNSMISDSNSVDLSSDSTSTLFMKDSNSTNRLVKSQTKNDEVMKQEGMETMSTFSSKKAESGMGPSRQIPLDGLDDYRSKASDFRRPSPVSILENSFSTASTSSLDSADISLTHGNRVWSKKFNHSDLDVDLSDSASSISNASFFPRKKVFSFESFRADNWEKDYIAKIVSNMETRLYEYALGRTTKIISPLLFDQLEARLFRSSPETKLERKVLFDSAVECLETRYKRYAAGGWNAGLAALRRKEWLVEAVHREVSTWRGMWSCMVDELVDRDMTVSQGRWTDFEADGFTVGGEIQNLIIDSLVEELLIDSVLQ